MPLRPTNTRLGRREPDLELIRSTAKAAAPTAVESIAYQMPALRLDGQFLVSYAAFKAQIDALLQEHGAMK